LARGDAPASMLELRRCCGHPGSVAGHEKPLRGILDPVARKLRLPFGTPDFIDRIIRGGVNQAGRRTLQMLITTWDATGGGPFAASAMATAGLAKTVDVAQGLFIGPVFDPLLKALGADQITFRAALCSSQVIGVGIMRYVVRVEPIASMDVDTLVDAVAPTLQRYLVEEIS
jgi:Tetracyclin repressor-like, C-terminal domain